VSTVITLGTFDLLHPGHVHLFRQCRRIAGDGTVHAAVNPDGFVESFKGRRPVQHWIERRDMVASLRFVDHVHVTPGADVRPLLDEVQPDFIVIGKDWAGRDYYGQLGIDQAYLDELDAAVVYLERVGDLSSTELKARVRDAS
jgi:glycerol-3-phosphate cytidylyltransferase